MVTFKVGESSEMLEPFLGSQEGNVLSFCQDKSADKRKKVVARLTTVTQISVPTNQNSEKATSVVVMNAKPIRNAGLNGLI